MMDQQEAWEREWPRQHPESGEPVPELQASLSSETWITRDTPPPDRLLGELITTTTRAFFVGRTGLGKTMFGFGMAYGIATGSGFLHWRSERPGRALVIDGEMPAELIRTRAVDAARRGGTPPPRKLFIYSRDTEEDFCRLFPDLGRMPPLNMEEGQNWMLALIAALGGVDVVIFDNVMSLVTGDQKDELAWSGTLPLVTRLTTKRIAQIWLDHTGHNTDRQYGSSTKSWRFDLLGMMTAVPDDQRQGAEIAFNLSFDYPGKARRRTPENRADFEPCIIRLKDDRWTSEIATAERRKKVSPKAKLFHDAMMDALARGLDCPAPGRITRVAWIAECVRRNLLEPAGSGEIWQQRHTRLAPFRKAIFELQAAGWIGSDGDTFSDLTRSYDRF